MNFKKLPKEKRAHLILVVVCTALIMGVLGFGLIKYQYRNIREVVFRKESKDTELQRMKETVKRADQTENTLAELTKTLSDQEDGMASGDLNLWIINTIRRFKLSYKVEIPQVSQPTVADVSLLPRFPYKQATVTVTGTAYYHDLGKFLADLENQFPHIRILNLALEPSSNAGPGEKEKLSFRIDIVVLVKPDVV